MAKGSGHVSGARQRARKRLRCKGLRAEIVQVFRRFPSTIEGVRAEGIEDERRHGRTRTGTDEAARSVRV